jgi:hypothetical protein
VDTDSDPNGLFTWQSKRVVIFVERGTAVWTLSRGWRSGDRLVDVRRWQFDSPRRAVGQMRRLVLDDSDDRELADRIAEELRAWLDS